MRKLTDIKIAEKRGKTNFFMMEGIHILHTFVLDYTYQSK
jgi:hypothetical protein